eukprot:3543876-Pyramimonas_sp.AAC.1
MLVGISYRVGLAPCAQSRVGGLTSLAWVPVSARSWRTGPTGHRPWSESLSVSHRRSVRTLCAQASDRGTQRAQKLPFDEKQMLAALTYEEKNEYINTKGRAFATFHGYLVMRGTPSRNSKLRTRSDASLASTSAIKAPTFQKGIEMSKARLS